MGGGTGGGGGGEERGGEVGGGGDWRRAGAARPNEVDMTLSKLTLEIEIERPP